MLEQQLQYNMLIDIDLKLSVIIKSIYQRNLM